MRRTLILCIMLLLLTIMGCDKKPDPVITTTTDGTTTTAGMTEKETTTDNREETTTGHNHVGSANGSNGEGQMVKAAGTKDAARLGVGKKLVWWISEYYCPDEAVVNRLNDLLVEKYGCDFTVEFKAYPVNINFDADNYMYYDMVLDMMGMGHQADILYSGNGNEYPELVKQGVYVSFTDYFTTIDGYKLYEAYAPEIWEMTEIDGCSYGYLSKVLPTTMAMALCNKELAAKYNIDLPTGEWSFYDVGKYLENAGVTQDILSDEEVLLACFPEALLLMEGYYVLDEYGSGIFFKQNEAGTWSMVNIAEEADFIKLLKQVKEYADKGWYTCMYSDELSLKKNQMYKNEQYGRFVFDFIYLYEQGNRLIDDQFLCIRDMSVCRVTRGKTSYAAVEPMRNMINGITSWSKYKDEAFKLITLIQTEAELSNLLQYGIEGVDYEYVGKVVKSLIPDETIKLPTASSAIGNMNLFHSVYVEPEDKLAYSKEISANCQAGPNMLYELDMDEYSEQLNEISTIYAKYEKQLFKALCDDVEATVAEMGEELAEAGIDEVIAAFNAQIKAGGDS